MIENKLLVFFKENNFYGLKTVKKITKVKQITHQRKYYELIEKAFNFFDGVTIRLFPNEKFTLELNCKTENNQEKIASFINQLFLLFGKDFSGFSARQPPYIDTDDSRHEDYCWYFDKQHNLIEQVKSSDKMDFHYGINFVIDDIKCDFCILEAQNVFLKETLDFEVRDQEKLSPKISEIKWGRIKIGNHDFKDAKCFPGGCREWNWKETGTKHLPGIQISDVQELLDNESTVIVLSKGFHERLETKKETIDFLKKRSIPFFILGTEKAVQKYNELAKNNKLVGGLFHSTC